MVDYAYRVGRLVAAGVVLPDECDVKQKSADEWVAIAEGLAKKNRGVLQGAAWLQKNGYCGLYQAMKRHPERFSRIVQERLHKSVGEQVALAERLVKENGGVLPCGGWLDKNGHGGMYQVMWKHPGRFSHIRQEKLMKSVDEWVAVAGRLAKKNRGVLQGTAWLQENGYSGLDRSMKTYPERFSHIVQERLRKTVDEQVVVAERLAKENGGVLPEHGWLRKNGYRRLYQVTRDYPERFARIVQEKLVKSIDEQVAVAEKLAKENGGVLGGAGWLQRNGHRGLYAMMKRHPEKFGHIAQERLHKTVDEWVVVAGGLARENGGVLPGGGWLQENGYSGLYRVTRDYPERFVRIVQERLRKTVDEQVVVAERLAKKNGGVIPGGGWLQRNGYRGLYAMMKRHPGMFRRIRKDKKARSVDWRQYEGRTE